MSNVCEATITEWQLLITSISLTRADTSRVFFMLLMFIAVNSNRTNIRLDCRRVGGYFEMPSPMKLSGFRKYRIPSEGSAFCPLLKNYVNPLQMAFSLASSNAGSTIEAQ